MVGECVQRVSGIVLTTSGPISSATYMTSEYALFLVPVLAHNGFWRRAPRPARRSHSGPWNLAPKRW